MSASPSILSNANGIVLPNDGYKSPTINDSEIEYEIKIQICIVDIETCVKIDVSIGFNAENPAKFPRLRQAATTKIRVSIARHAMAKIWTDGRTCRTDVSMSM